jgi:hypothetical protein
MPILQDEMARAPARGAPQPRPARPEPAPALPAAARPARPAARSLTTRASARRWRRAEAVLPMIIAVVTACSVFFSGGNLGAVSFLTQGQGGGGDGGTPSDTAKNMARERRPHCSRRGGLRRRCLPHSCGPLGGREGRSPRSALPYPCPPSASPPHPHPPTPPPTPPS